MKFGIASNCLHFKRNTKRDLIPDNLLTIVIGIPVFSDPSVADEYGAQLNINKIGSIQREFLFLKAFILQ